jgi:hypothetical protein
VCRYEYGARFYDAQIGRWTTKEPFAELVPSISLYAYCYDSPVNYTEPSGLWPGWVHKHIIRKALNPYLGHGLTIEQLNQIIEAGAFIDANYQAAQFSYMHSMRNGVSGESVLEAKEARDEWVNEQIALFKQWGDYKYLGYAIHAMSDEHSPTHSWKPWYGQSKWNPSSWIHFFGELNPLRGWSKAFKASVILVNNTYKEATSQSSTGSTSGTAHAPNISPNPSPAPEPDPPKPPATPAPPETPPPRLVTPIKIDPPSEIRKQ